MFASVRTAIVALIWVLALLIGFRQLLGYSNRPGLDRTALVARWPEASRLERQRDLPTLVMFAHPRCPCTRASIRELERMMAHFAGRLTVHVLFVRPAGMSVGWEKTDLWDTAARIPGVRVAVDESGVSARLFRADTSGQVLLYDPAGQLLLSGGITDSRGHEGASAGRSTIEALLAGWVGERSRFPVFGCALFQEDEHE